MTSIMMIKEAAETIAKLTPNEKIIIKNVLFDHNKEPKKARDILSQKHRCHYWDGYGTYARKAYLAGSLLYGVLDIRDQGNDSPRGGIEGNWIQFSNTQRNCIMIDALQTAMSFTFYH